MLQGRDSRAACVWRGCDPYSTAAVTGVTGDGGRSNCGRTNKDGIDYVKSAGAGFERHLALYFTPQEAGGCQGCRFFLMCKGHCPGTALRGDWRHKTEHCEIWKALYGDLERELIAGGVAPVSLSPCRDRMEKAFLADWGRGDLPDMASILGVPST